MLMMTFYGSHLKISGLSLLLRVRAPPLEPWPDAGPESLGSPCGGLASFKNQNQSLVCHSPTARTPKDKTVPKILPRSCLEFLKEWSMKAEERTAVCRVLEILISSLSISDLSNLAYWYLLSLTF
ncbi:hypothetical protein PoB_001497100 [Plakobranchus ocellatus]|uniref:Uncharacterized protein n=1 Tax=Plakobranchus ocellatus TaxID=259542 RepID=A0AAV3Z1M1_9GAST|nr:hypothetical protein PoB_001497100 [Plakobranchus ocellatus]